jgi:hypothetical protein
MHNRPAARWDGFTPCELQALDEFFRSFGPLRESNPDIHKLGEEIAAAMLRRGIRPFGPVDPEPRIKASVPDGLIPR